MKDSIGGVFLFQIVIAFILLFTAIMCLTINRSRAVAVKDEIIQEIERDGFNINSGDLNNLNDILDQTSYRTVGPQPNDSEGNSDTAYNGYDREGNPVGDNENGSIWIKKVEIENTSTNNSGDSVNSKSCYYSVVLFFKLDIPVMKNIFIYDVIGETKILYGDKWCS